MKRTLKQGDIVKFRRRYRAHRERGRKPIEAGELFVIEEIDNSIRFTHKIRSLRYGDLLTWSVPLDQDDDWLEFFG